MPDIIIRIEGDERLRRIMRNPEFVRGPFRRFLTRSAFIVEKAEKEKAPVDTGRLRSSIFSQVQERRASIGPTVYYAAYVEFGTRPHWPPRGALQPWARRHGFPPGNRGDFLVRRIIALRGTKPHPFMAPAARASQSGIKRAFREMMQEIGTRWSGRAI